MKTIYQFFLLGLMIVIAGCSDQQTLETTASEESAPSEESGQGDGSITSTVSVGDFSFSDVKSSFYTENTDGSVDIYLQDIELGCFDFVPGETTDVIGMAGVPVAVGAYRYSMNDDEIMNMFFYTMTADGKEMRNYTDVSEAEVTITDVSSDSIKGSFVGYFYDVSDDAEIRGEFEAEKCDYESFF